MYAFTRKIVASPNEFIAGELEDPDLVRPLLVVTLAGFLIGLSSAVTVPLRPEQFEGQAVYYLYAGIGFNLVISVLTFLLIWVFLSGTFFTIGTVLFEGVGEFRDLLKVSGWGFAGQVVSGSISLTVNVLVLQQVDASTAAMTTQQLTSHPAFFASSVVSFGMFLWSMWLWALTTMRVLKLSPVRAGLTVLAPVGFASVLYLLGMGLTGLP